jgi:hypothetical protein
MFSVIFMSFIILILFILVLIYIKSRGSAVGTATRYGLEDQGVGVRVPARSIIFTSFLPDLFWAQPSSYTMVTGGAFPVVKAAGA